MPVQPTYPGVYVLEQPSGVNAIAGVSTSVGAFIGMCPAGPINVPTRVFSARDFETTFGGSVNVGEMVDQVRQFFLNGGSTAWIVRNAAGALDGGTLVARSVLKSESGDDVLALSARTAGTIGNEVRVEVDYNTASPESTFNITAYRARTRADGSIEQIGLEVLADLSMNPASPRYAMTIINQQSALLSAGPPAAPPAPAGVNLSQSGLIFGAANAIRDFFNAHVAGPSHFIAVSVANGPPVLVNLGGTTGADTAATLTEMQNRIRTQLATQGVQVTVAARAAAGGQVLQITSGDGPVVITSAASNDVAATLRLGVGNGGLETDRFAALRPAANGVVTRVHTGNAIANAFARVHALADAALDDFALWRIEGGTIGTIAPAAPVFAGAAKFGADGTTGLNGVIGSFAAVASALDILAASIANDPSGNFTARREGLRVSIRPTYGSDDADLSLRFTSPGGQAYQLQGNGGIAQTSSEPTNVVRYALGALTPAIPADPAGAYRTHVQSGNDGAAPQPADYEYSFDKLERTADIFNLMVLPRAIGQTDGDRAAVWGPASAFCQRRRAFLLVDPPMDPANAGRWKTANDAAAGAQALRSGLVADHAALYWPRVVTSDARGKPITIDPSGTMAGVYARTDVRRGVWKAPAGLEASLTGVRSLELAVTDMENGPTNQQAVNTLRILSPGATSWGARTMLGYDGAADQDYRYVPVRRLALMIEESLYRGLQFAVFEPNGETLWGQIRLAAGSFMDGLFRQGAFKGLKASDAYYVACGPTTTSPADIALGIVNVEVGFAPLRPAEFVVVTVRQLVGQVEV